MNIDWSLVKKKTLWQYDDLIRKIFDVLSYSFVKKYYNHSVSDSIKYSETILNNYIQNGKKPTFIKEITKYLKELDNLEINNYLEFIKQIDSKDKCKSFH